MGIALGEIRKGGKVIEAQLASGYDSASGFRDAFSKIMGFVPIKLTHEKKVLYSSITDTPLGNMLAIYDDDKLYLLEFTDRRGLELEIEKLRKKTSSVIITNKNRVIDYVEEELSNYFNGKLCHFNTKLALIGSAFQKTVWENLVNIPYGQTRSYKEQAICLGKENGYRAVANANGANQIAIIIPCHRIINSNGSLSGYGGGLNRKAWLLNHELSNQAIFDIVK